MMDEEKKRELCRTMMTQDPRLARTILTYFEEDDFQRISDHKTGGGVIGGKACGFVLVEKIMETLLGEYADRWERCPSWFVGTEVFCQVRDGKPLETFREEFEKILDYFDGSPYIVRSSSLMEDGYDNAFFGKYESVFCADQGTEEERIQEMMEAVSKVYGQREESGGGGVPEEMASEGSGGTDGAADSKGGRGTDWTAVFSGCRRNGMLLQSL